MKVINLGKDNSILNDFIAQIRDVKLQKNRLMFRHNLERIGRIFGYEISKTLSYREKEVQTPLGIATISVCDSKPVVANILRAGLPIMQGLLDCFEDSDAGFIAAYRKYDRGNDFHINIEYSTFPAVAGRVLILADTMLATGASMEVTLEKLFENGRPSHTHIVCPITSTFAVEQLQKSLPDDITLWTAAEDEELTSHFYIVPGLGDAGDLAYGEKP